MHSAARVGFRVLVAALCGPSACAPPQEPESVPREPPPASVLPATLRAPASVVPACGGVTGPSPVCEGACAPDVVWTQTYGNAAGFLPGLLSLEIDTSGHLVLAGITGRGPTYLGGKPLYTGWPRGFGEAFVAKYDRAGEHLWSRQLFETTPEERKRGGRSSVWALTLGAQGALYAFVSRVSVEQAGTHLVTVGPDGRTRQETWVRRGLPTLFDLTEREGQPSALGVRDEEGPTLELADHRIEPSGSVYYERKGVIPRPPGILGLSQAHWHPRGALWTSVRHSESTGRATVGGHSECPVYDTRQEKNGALVRLSPAARAESCPWLASEMLAVFVGPSGAPEWQRSFAVPGYDASPDSVAVDAAGNTYWVAAFTGMARFGDKAVCALELPAGYADDFFGEMDARCECLRDYADVFVLKVDPSGNPLWVERIGQHMEDRAGPFVVDALGRVIVTVRSTPQPDFTKARKAPPTPVWSIFAFDGSGAALWTHRLSTTAQPVLTSGPDGTVYVAETVRAPEGVRLTALR